MTRPMADGGEDLARYFEVVRVAARAKQPYVGSRRSDNVSRDSGIIQRWGLQTPDANVGVAGSSGFIIVDVDPRNGGDKLLVEWEHHHQLPRTATSSTPGDGLLRGQHRYFRSGLPTRYLSGGIDIISEGNYAVAPPSIINLKPGSFARTGEYRWIHHPDDVGIAQLPPESEQFIVGLTARDPKSFDIEVDCERLPGRRRELSDYYAQLVSQGSAVGRFPERDSLLGAVIMKMVASRWTFDQACALVLNPTNAVGEKLREKGQRWAERELDRTWRRCMAEVMRIETIAAAGHHAVDLLGLSGKAGKTDTRMLHHLLDQATQRHPKFRLDYDHHNENVTALVATSCRTTGEDLQLRKDTVSASLRRLEQHGILLRIEKGNSINGTKTPSWYDLELSSPHPQNL